MKNLAPNDFGKKLLVEDCQKIKIKDLLKDWQSKFKEHLLESSIILQDQKISLCTSKTYYNGLRYWFKCPLCGKRATVLFQQPLDLKVGCRTCLNLDYRKRRYKGMREEKLLEGL